MLRISVWRWDNPATAAPYGKSALMVRLIRGQVNAAARRRSRPMAENLAS
jgi:hypothetical protein